MKVILLMSDTVRWDYLGFYGGNFAKTPNFDKFAAQSHVFDKAYMASFPTVPNRRDIFTGKACYTYAGWQPLDAYEVTLAQVLGQGGIKTQLFSDTPHTIKDGYNFTRGFHGWEWIRGQETDEWKNMPDDVKLPCAPEKCRYGLEGVKQHLQNINWWKNEEDTFVARTSKAACAWLEEAKKNNVEKFFLYVDTFDPHEPWDVLLLDEYRKMYGIDLNKELPFYPRYAPATYLSAADIDMMRRIYAAEVSLTDKWYGKIIDKVKQLGMDDDTYIIYTTDHGFFLGEHCFTGKSYIDDVGGGGGIQQVPFFEEVAHIPLVIHEPGQTEGERHKALTVSQDLFPTILQMFGLMEADALGGFSMVQMMQCGFLSKEAWKLDPKTLHGKSLLPIINFEEDQVHEIAVSSYSITHKTPVQGRCQITDGRYKLIYCGDGDIPPCTYKDKCGDHPTDIKLGDFSPMLFDLDEDPKELKNIIKDKPKIAKELHAKYVAQLESWKVNEEYLKYRRRLDI